MGNSYFWNKKIIVSYILSILVFWIHLSTFANYGYGSNNGAVLFSLYFFKRTINEVAVPLFFVLAGVAFYRDYDDKKYVKKLLSRVKSLVIPFLLWNIAGMIFNGFASAFLSQYFIGREKVVISIPNILLGIFHYKYNGAFWFVFALIVFTVAAPIIDKLLYSKITGILSVVALLVLYYFDIGLPHPLFFTKTCIIYYLIGGFIGRFYFDKFSTPLPKKYQVASFMIILMAIVYYMLINYGVIHRHTISDVLVLVFLCICFWNMMDLFLPSKLNTVPEFMKHSFWVFALHGNVGSVVTKLLYFVLPKNPYISIVNFILSTIITLVLIEFACFAIKKISPPVYNLLSGSR